MGLAKNFTGGPTLGEKSLKTNFQKVQEFMVIGQQAGPPFPALADQATADLRIRLIEEELRELKDAIAEGNLVEIADAVQDLLYVVYGTGEAYGLPVDRLFDEVHRSNMTKFPNGVCTKVNGKIVKPDTYEKPDLASIINGEKSNA